MVWSKPQSSAGGPIWKVVRRQHGVIARRQLLELGVSRRGIEHRIATGRLYPLMRGVYAVGRSEVTRHGRWMAAILACGPGAVLSHRSAAALWGIDKEAGDLIDVSVRASSFNDPPGLRVHRRRSLRLHGITEKDDIPLTCVVLTLIDLAAQLDERRLERAVNEADRLDLVDPETLRASLGAYRGQPGVARLRALLDRRTFRLTDSELERRFLPLVDSAGLPRPLTRQHVNGFRVDFYWPDLGLVVETDGLRYHRTPA